MAAELQAKELEAVHREEEKRVQMLEETRRTLERLLEEETQAKRDEEIVRNLQGRLANLILFNILVSHVYTYSPVFEVKNHIKHKHKMLPT